MTQRVDEKEEIGKFSAANFPNLGKSSFLMEIVFRFFVTFPYKIKKL